jgi:hypothetical protein
MSRPATTSAAERQRADTAGPKVIPRPLSGDLEQERST